LDHRKALAALTAVTLCIGCASARWTLVKHFRNPGEVLQTFPEKVWAEYDCDTQKRPFFMIERNQLTPQKVRAGGDFGHRLVYVMCPDRPTEVVEGRLSTRIRFRGRPIVRQTDSHYEIKPGRWMVDALVHLPENAEPGVYAYEVEFESDRLVFEKSLTFVVVETRAKSPAS
jgi:hypothetical protein